MYMKSEDVLKFKKNEDLKQIQGTRKYHSFVPQTGGTIKSYIMSTDKHGRHHNLETVTSYVIHVRILGQNLQIDSLEY